jgi:hypothetical protein
MNIDFNSFFRLRVDIHAVRDNQYQLTMERVDLEDEFYTSKTEYFLTKDQLKQLVDYFNEAYNGIE